MAVLNSKPLMADWMADTVCLPNDRWLAAPTPNYMTLRTPRTSMPAAALESQLKTVNADLKSEHILTFGFAPKRAKVNAHFSLNHPTAVFRTHTQECGRVRVSRKMTYTIAMLFQYGSTLL